MTGLNLKLRVNDRHIEAAARAAKALEELRDGPDAQLALTLVCMYLCSVYRFGPLSLVSLLRQNLLLLGRQVTVTDMLNGMHARMTKTKFSLPDDSVPVGVTQQT